MGLKYQPEEKGFSYELLKIDCEETKSQVFLRLN